MADRIDKKAHAYPTKAFFVRMITRDISLDDCILDLIDNSIDSAWTSSGSRPMGLAQDVDLSAFRIDIEATPECFSIRDNCGGMSLDNAVDHAFSFGRSSLAEHDDFSIGVYGIGMKRAVFKLGSNITIRSTFDQEDGAKLSFAVPIDVGKWLEDDAPPWDFDIVGDEPLADNGVEVCVKNLTPGTRASFSSPAYLNSLKRTIARDYSLHLGRGLKIYLNAGLIAGWQIELVQSDDFQPVRLSYEDEVDGDIVAVEIIGGMAASPPEDNDPDESMQGDRRYGWYVICNGRIVLAADKSATTGWGTENWPQWHFQYAGFIGVVLFTAAKASALPLTTTKRNVDSSSEVFRRARHKMRDVSRAWIDYTNYRKQALEEAKRRERAAVPVALAAIAKRTSVALPAFTAQPAERSANINYTVPLSKLRKLAKELGNVNMTYREVGLKSFDYTYDDLVGKG